MILEAIIVDMNTEMNERELAIPKNNAAGYYVVGVYAKILVATYEEAVAYKKRQGGSLWTRQEWERREKGW